MIFYWISRNRRWQLIGLTYSPRGAWRRFVPCVDKILGHEIVEEQSSDCRRCACADGGGGLVGVREIQQYAADCLRIARTMNAKDKQTLIEIAAAWDSRAQEAEQKGKKSNPA